MNTKLWPARCQTCSQIGQKHLLWELNRSTLFIHLFCARLFIRLLLILFICKPWHFLQLRVQGRARRNNPLQVLKKNHVDIERNTPEEEKRACLSSVAHRKYLSSDKTSSSSRRSFSGNVCTLPVWGNFCSWLSRTKKKKKLRSSPWSHMTAHVLKAITLGCWCVC